MSTELALHEERAQHGIIEFAEEMQFIRDENLYPGAKRAPDAWKTYCKERWGMGGSTVDDHIRALPVLRRFSTAEISAVEMPSVSAAAAVANLPEPVQDKILTESPRRHDASDKATAVRRAQKRIERSEGREATVEELVEVAKAPLPKAKKPKATMKDSKFTHALEMAYFEIERAADIANASVLTETENDYGWKRVEKIEYEITRLKDRLSRPDHVRDVDAEFAELVEGNGGER